MRWAQLCSPPPLSPPLLQQLSQSRRISSSEKHASQRACMCVGKCQSAARAPVQTLGKTLKLSQQADASCPVTIMPAPSLRGVRSRGKKATTWYRPMPWKTGTLRLRKVNMFCIYTWYGFGACANLVDELRQPGSGQRALLRPPQQGHLRASCRLRLSEGPATSSLESWPRL